VPVPAGTGTEMQIPPEFRYTSSARKFFSARNELDKVVLVDESNNAEVWW